MAKDRLRLGLLGAHMSAVDVLSCLVHLRVVPDVVFGPLTGQELSSEGSGSCLQELSNLSGIPYEGVRSYSLTEDVDTAAFSRYQLDVLIVAGWQRLVPGCILSQLRLGAVGAHGSAHGLEKGRGRSPQNWAIIRGHDEFELAAFWLTEGIDDGPVIGRVRIPMTSRDDIVSSYLKVSQAYATLIAEALDSGQLARREGLRQQGQSLFLPRRLPEDGWIDWHASACEIDALVRATTTPYPGARTATESGQEVGILRARPFEYGHWMKEASPGSVVQVGTAGALVVAAGEQDFLLVDDWYAFDESLEISPGTCFSSVSRRRQMERIVERHLFTYPDQPLSPCVLDETFPCDLH